MIVNQIKRMIPTLKVNNRNLNELFYIETLGMTTPCLKSLHSYHLETSQALKS